MLCSMKEGRMEREKRKKRREGREEGGKERKKKRKKEYRESNTFPETLKSQPRSWSREVTTILSINSLI